MVRTLLKTLGLFSILLVGCSDNQTSLKLVKPTGSFHIGTTNFTFMDSTRPETFTSDPEDNREVALKIWYPAEESSCITRAPYIENALERKKRLPANSPLPPLFFETMAEVESNSYYDAGVSEKHGNYPLLLFSHASGAGMTANTVLMEELASHGYVTVSIGHAYETSHFIHEDGSLTVFDPNNAELRKRALERMNSFALQRKLNDTFEDDELIQIIRQLMDMRPKMMESLRIWVEDISFAIDKLEDLNTSEGRFFKRFDMERIGVMGHSFGGAAAGQTCLSDERCKAGVNLDGLQIGDMIQSPLQKPFMFIHHDNINARNKTPNSPFYNESKAPCYMIMIEGTTHFNFSDLSLPIYAQLLNPPEGFLGSIDGYRCLDIQNQFIRAFFDTYLRQQDAPLLDSFTREYPEVCIDGKD